MATTGSSWMIQSARTVYCKLCWTTALCYWAGTENLCQFVLFHQRTILVQQDIFTALQIIREAAEPLTKAVSHDGALRVIVPHLDDLSNLTTGRGTQVQALVVSGSIVRKRNPPPAPPIRNDGPLRLPFAVVEVTTIQQFFPDVPFRADGLQRQELPTIKKPWPFP